MDNLLSIVTFIPAIAAAILLIFLPGGDSANAARNAKWVALIATVITFLVSLFILAGFAIVCGFFIDTLPAPIILTPILGPIAFAAGIDPLQFGMMLVLNLTIGMITPPVGPVLFVIATVGRLRVEALFKAVLPLLLAELCVLLLVILVPEVSTFVPRYFGFAN